MKIAILGASQGTGAEAAKIALARGHEVLAFGRNPARLAIEHPKLTRLAGDFHQRDSVAAAVRGQDAVIITASATRLSAFKANPNYFSQGTAYTIEAMRAHGPRRLVVLSAFGVGASRELNNFLVQKLLFGLLLKLPYEDHERQERLVEESGLDWVIAQATKLTNGRARGRYVKTAELKPVPQFISRADTADFLVCAAESDDWVRKTVLLGG
jgi:putative NADH-flavin reductase